MFQAHDHEGRLAIRPMLTIASNIVS